MKSFHFSVCVVCRDSNVSNVGGPSYDVHRLPSENGLWRKSFIIMPDLWS